MSKIALINGIFMGIFKIYLFVLPILDPFLALFEPFMTLGYIWGQIPINCHNYVHVKNYVNKQKIVLMCAIIRVYILSKAYQKIIFEIAIFQYIE